MRRLLPHPWMAALLLVVWLLLRHSLAPGTWVAGGLLAWILAWTYGRLAPPPARVRHLPTLLRLFARVAADIVRSNFAVARLVLGRRRRVHAGFVAIPLALTDPHGLALLACIITSTPGTIWVEHDPQRSVLLIHVLDLVDETVWVEAIKRRYEQPLLRVFQS
ncbi:MAG: Na+/H+ antiporter subunit E [Rhodanobacter sp.]|nr:MAG: Na+/H+ antiporter subunit E [Rhodanobacter sp.]TAM10448.1 MAG: Na+/H+ antiporter subunit E [Rhodanobacter sp.]TAM36295.1 MAG: Na+/H+ antiporter subunit E [Rhodanobacter sp.]